MRGEDSSRDRKLIAVMAGFGAVCVTAAIVLLIVLDRNDNEPPAGTSPTGTVRQFLTAAAVEDNGDVACTYLTRAEKLRVKRAAKAASCSAGFYAGSLTLGGTAYGGDLKALAFSAADGGGGDVVTVSAGISSVIFRLAPATAAERNEFDAPATPWRIDSGAAAVATGAQDSS
ncbi:MAG: hypothetical protein QOJ57_2341 [Thermoleophilaceae bacterium]|nr:hypothetical protein [Thermoleophilaceae bacterium]